MESKFLKLKNFIVKKRRSSGWKFSFFTAEQKCQNPVPLNSSQLIILESKSKSKLKITLQVITEKCG